MTNFALIGAAGYVAPRHMKAIRDIGNTLVAALDPHDSVGILDYYGHDIAYFKEPERFDRHLYKCNSIHADDSEYINYVSICSPNYLHDAHIRLALRSGCNAICEKPLVINPWNLDALEELQIETGNNVYCILQLRHHPKVLKLKEEIESDDGRVYDVNLNYVTKRGAWYKYSWKGDISKSGGLIYNIGIHLFDMLIWLFGPVHDYKIEDVGKSSVRGKLYMDRAMVRWFLSTETDNNIDYDRSMCVDGKPVDFTFGFGDLHTEAYRAIMDGNGPMISDVRPSIDLAGKLSDEIYG